uniref:tRNA (uracil-5-)-methyltransferase homolog A n=1 Tax=Myxine glutinosa TaxID=7769 RepID=UPI00358F0A6B
MENTLMAVECDAKQGNAEVHTTAAISDSRREMQEVKVREDVEMFDQRDEKNRSKELYEYVNDCPFTSEIYKIEICGLPRRCSFTELKKFLGRLNLHPRKVKLFSHHSFAFVTFPSEAERGHALKALKELTWKGCALRVKVAKPRIDPLVKKSQAQECGLGETHLKRKELEAEADQVEQFGAETKKQRIDEAEKNDVQENRAEGEELLGGDVVSIEERVMDAVTPFWRDSYAVQLERKGTEMCRVLRRLARDMWAQNSNLCHWLAAQKRQHGGLPCPFLGVKASPELDGYRNKCEFNVGMGENGEVEVGFRLGAYRNGSCTVGPVTSSRHVSNVMKQAAAVLKEFFRSSRLSVYDPRTYRGYWRQVTLRTTKSGQMMVLVCMHPQALSEEELKNVGAELCRFFDKNPGGAFPPSSLYLALQGQRSSTAEDLKLQHLAGSTFITERMLALDFRISPLAFFQVNTVAAEVLYTVVGEWCGVTRNSIVLDVCCGTGTIGLSLAKKVQKVVGVEMNEQAVQDARENARMNGVVNAEFHCGRAEVLLPELLNTLGSEDIIAVVDPPRAGLHSRVVLSLRRTKVVTRLLYLACNPRAASVNLIDLTRAPSHRARGQPFRLMRATAIDLFPHTPHCELLLLFERNLDFKTLPCDQGPHSNAQGADLDAQLGDRGTDPIVQPADPGVHHAERVADPGVQPAERVADPGVQPAERVADPGVQPAERVADPGVQPTERVADPGVQPAERVADPGVQPTERVADPGMQPAERVADPGVQPAERVADPGVQPAERVADPGVQPAERVADRGVQPAERVADPGVQPAERVADPGVQPAERVADPGVQPAERVADPGVQPTERVADPGVQPAERVADPGVQPAERVADPGVQPAERVADPGVQPAERVADPGVQPAERVADHGVQPTERVADHGVQPAERVADPGVQPAERVADPGVQPAERVADPGVQPAERVADPGVQPAERVADPGVQPAERVTDPGVQCSPPSSA